MSDEDIEKLRNVLREGRTLVFIGINEDERHIVKEIAMCADDDEIDELGAVFEDGCGWAAIDNTTLDNYRVETRIV